MATRKTATKAKPKAKPVVEEELIEEVEEVEEAEIFGVSDVVELIGTQLKKNTSTRELRTLLRKMARDGRLTREIIPGNRARWEFAGPEDPQVKAILKAFKDGELEADKQEKLAALKERKAAQQAAKKAAAAAAAPAGDEDDELEDDE